MSPRHTIQLSAALALLGSIVAMPASAATLTVGPGQTHATPCKAFAAAQAGDTINITGNTTYRGDVCAIKQNKLT
ncbi:hypothetical protein SB767_33520, partial [Bacillus sp. SIMBA_069]